MSRWGPPKNHGIAFPAVIQDDNEQRSAAPTTDAAAPSNDSVSRSPSVDDKVASKDNGSGDDLVDTDDDENHDQEQQEDAANAANSSGDDDDYDDFELIGRVEWGPRRGEDGYDTDQELAPRPRQKAEETCQCLRQPGACSDYSCLLFACHEECRGQCPAGEFCGNKRLQQPWLFPKLNVIPCGPKGKGLLTLEAITKGQVCAEYVGRAVKAGKLKQLFRRYQLERRLYIMALDEGIYLDARQRGSIARYINHSCNPNCKVERWKVRGVVRAAVVALRDIDPQQELTFDYKWERKRGRAPTKCHCGEPNCRGTLELPKSLDETNLEQQLQDQWLKSNLADASIINRTVRVFLKEHDEYFLGEVTGYNSDNQQHSILYRHDMNEVWEDLRKEDWMILDADVDKSDIMIAKKSKRRRRASPTAGLVAAPLPSDDVGQLINFLYVQSATFATLKAKHKLELCERLHNVQIHTQEFCKPPLPPNETNPDDVAKYQAFESSPDGTVWKLTITGPGIDEAYKALEKHVAYFDRKKELDNGIGGNSAAISSALGLAASAGVNFEQQQQQRRHQVIFPREISDFVKRDLPSLRAKCRSVNLAIGASESVSKQFGRLVMDGKLASDIDSAKETLWSALLVMCAEAEAPLAPNKLPKNLGIYAGELTAGEYRLLVTGNDNDKTDENRLRMDASEDLRGICPFISSFEYTQKCTVWVQADYDKGRINSSNQVVGKGDMNSSRHVFIGYSPKEVARLWKMIRTRISDIERGVKYLHLGMDRIYQKLMMTSGNKFFDFVMKVATVKLEIDSVTGDHIRIDGRLTNDAMSSSPSTTVDKTELERASLAEEVIRLQIEIYRDHCTREQNWIFGRDWSLVSNALPESIGCSTSSGSIALGLLDTRTASLGTTEISETIALLGLDNSVAAHASIILYRFAVTKAANLPVKVRDATFACIFLANKCQKQQKWKRLDQVVKTGYEAMYKSKLDQNQDLRQLSDRILETEANILETLDYDIFWQGISWIHSAATGTGLIRQVQTKDIFDFMFSAPILGCGHELWLRYGAEYIFAVAAGLLDVSLDHLLPALSLIPLKVSRAAELLVETVRIVRPLSKNIKVHRLLENDKSELERRLNRMKEICITAMSQGYQSAPVDTEIVLTDQRYRIIGRQRMHRFVMRGISARLMQDCIMRLLSKIAAESSCAISVDRGSAGDLEDIMFEGSWRGIYLADHLLRQAVVNVSKLPDLEGLQDDPRDRALMQSKAVPGRINGTAVSVVNGWQGTILSKLCNQSVDDRLLGGKSCVAGRAPLDCLRDAGLRWWLPREHMMCSTGSLADSFIVRSSNHIDCLGEIARSMHGTSVNFPMLSSLVSGESGDQPTKFAAVSLQQWPSGKVLARESTNISKLKVAIGFSAAALQEMQLLTQLHGMIPSPFGHPNLLLPVGIAVTMDKDADPSAGDQNRANGDAMSMELLNDPLYSLFQTRGNDNKAPDCLTSTRPRIFFEASPFVLQRFVSKKYSCGLGDLREHPALLASWFHDLLSALVHCHANNLVLRSIQLDQIAVDQTGTLKLGGLYKSFSLDAKQRERPASKVHADLLRSAKVKANEKEKRKTKDNVEDTVLPYNAPEILLGCPDFSQATDIWAVGCILAHLLLNKPLFLGTERASLFKAMVKIVGTPREDNFELLKKFPLYSKPDKKYKRGVEKALEHMLKDDTAEFSKAADLIGRMLHLDPTKRCSAAEALGHEYMAEYVEQSNTASFREQYAKQWTLVKTAMLKQARGLTETSQTKRTAMLMASRASNEDDDDDLYDVEDLMAGQPNKRSKSDDSSLK